jgi:MFS family permease
VAEGTPEHLERTLDQAPEVAGRRLGVDYWKLWTASAVSNFGDGVRLTALPLLAATLTRDPVLVSGVFTAGFLPWLLFSLVSGALVDRWDRRVMMVTANVFRAVAIGLLGAVALVGFESLPLVYVIAFLIGTAETLFDNAAQALLPQVVGKKNLETANGRLQTAEVVANQFVGPPVGALLFALAAGTPFLVDGGTFAFSAILILSITGLPRQARSPAALSRIPTEIREGLRWLWRHRVLRTLAAMVGIWNLMSMAWGAIMVLFALDVLGLSELGFGLLLSSYAVGGAVGGLLARRVSRAVGPGTALLLAVVTSGIVVLVAGLASDPILVGAMFAITGFVGLVWNVITVSLRQSIIPDHLLGRVNSVYRLLAWGTIPVGAALGGVLANTFGLRAPFLVAAAVQVVMALLALPVVNDRTIAESRAAATD